MTVSGRLGFGRKRMDLAELRPCHGEHLRCGIQFHRAGSERDHRSRQRQIPRFEPVQITHQPGLGVMSIKDRVGQIRRRANKLFGKIDSYILGKFLDRKRLIIDKKIQQGLEILLGNRFVQSNSDRVVVEKPEIDQGFPAFFARTSLRWPSFTRRVSKRGSSPTSKPSFSKARAKVSVCNWMRSAICLRRSDHDRRHKWQAMTANRT